VEMELLHAPALDAREAHITPEAGSGTLQHGRHVALVPHASGLRVTVR
jgi:hypothetical protein